MNNVNPRRRLALIAVYGIAGFLLVLLAIISTLAAWIFAGGYVFGGGFHSLKDSVVTSIFVPLLISLGAMVPARALGAAKWRAILAGIVAMVAFVFVELGWREQVDYGIFSQRETLAYIAAILVSVLVSTFNGSSFLWRVYGLIFVFALALIGIRLILPEENVIMGFVISLSGWIVLPLTVAFAQNEIELFQ